MSRVIKFRYVARHEYAGDVRLFTHALDLNSIEDTIDVIDLICSEIDPCTCCFNESKNHCDCDSVLDHGEFEIISRDQFTGLKDKNGVEIYDGDILTNEDFSDEADYMVVIMNERGCFVASDRDNSRDFLFLDDLDFVVVGNIHQGAK